jgi:hypothetical protein
MKLNPPKNENYAATVVELKTFVDLPNCDNVKAALIFGNSVIVDKKSPIGEVGLFFPVETALSPEFLSNNNLYRKPEFGNVDANKKGFFEQHGRVKAVKFRGHKSEGFYVPLSSLDYLATDTVDKHCTAGCTLFDLEVGMVFDAIGDHEICKKYIARGNPAGKNSPAQKMAKFRDQITENQFRFHFDTTNLRRNIDKINPEDWISITDKWHGTSVVISNVLIKRQLPWYEKLLKRIGVSIQESKYGVIYSSRKVIKGIDGKNYQGNGYYEDDIYGIVAKEVQDLIPKGFTLYGEIAGYTPSGQPIQKGYHYECQVGSHRFLVYRITSTNADGQTLELSWPQRIEFCRKYGLEHVQTLYYGKAESIYLLSGEIDWHERLLEVLEKTYIREKMCPYNNNEVPAEGIVVQVDGLNEARAYKLKNFRFLERESKELDKGEVDLETAQSEEVVLESSN